MTIEIKRCSFCPETRQWARSLAQALEWKFNIKPKLRMAGWSVLDVMVNGRTIYSKPRGQALPELHEVMSAIHSLCIAAGEEHDARTGTRG